jgi:hypothetical protein
MTLPLAAGLATLLSIAVSVLIAVWYVGPWLNRLPRAVALTLLLWVHIFRYAALQIFSASQFGFGASLAAQQQIAYGDVAGALLALFAIAALRYRWPLALFLVWVFAIESSLDLVNASVVGAREQLLATANGVTWLIINFYAPLLWVSLGLLIWQLFARRLDPLFDSLASNRSPQVSSASATVQPR